MKTASRSTVIIMSAALLFTSEATARLEGSVRQVFIDQFMQTCLAGQKSQFYGSFLPEHVLYSYCTCNAEITANRLHDADLSVEQSMTARQQNIGYEVAYYCRDNLSEFMEKPEAVIEGYQQPTWSPDSGEQGSTGGSTQSTKTESSGMKSFRDFLEEERRIAAMYEDSDTPAQDAGFEPSEPKSFQDFLAIERQAAAKQPEREPKGSLWERVQRIKEEEAQTTPWHGIDLQDPGDQTPEIPRHTQRFWETAHPEMFQSSGMPGARAMSRTGEIEKPSKDEVSFLGDFRRDLADGVTRLFQSHTDQSAASVVAVERQARIDHYRDLRTYAQHDATRVQQEAPRVSSRDEERFLRVRDAASHQEHFSSREIALAAPLIVGASGIIGVALSVLFQISEWVDGGPDEAREMR